MNRQSPGRVAVVTLVLAVFPGTCVEAQQLRAPSSPTKGFDPASRMARTPPANPGKFDPSATVVALTQHGNVNGGVDHGYNNVGVVFGAKIYSGNLANAIELYYYLPSDSDYLYREGDYRGSTGRIGNKGGGDGGEYYCPDGYAGIGLQGASGLAIDRLALVCGKIGDLARAASLPMFGGNGGNAFYDSCANVPNSSGFLTGVRVRSGAWMDSIQALCQSGTGAAASPVSAAAPAPVSAAAQAPAPKPVVKLADERVAGIAVGASRSEVIEKLGEPNYKISGDSERFTYELESGGTFRLVIEEGHVTQVQNSGRR